MQTGSAHPEDSVTIASTFCRFQTSFDLVPQTIQGLEILGCTPALISFQRNPVCAPQDSSDVNQSRIRGRFSLGARAAPD